MLITKLNPVRWIKSRRLMAQSKKRNKMLQATKLIAITGSAGKTSTGHILQHLLSYSGKSVVFLSTSGIWVNGENTEPDFVLNVATPQEVNELVIKFASQGIELILLEAPATSIAKKTFIGMSFDSITLTNIGGGDFARDFSSEQEYAQTIFSVLHQVQEEGLAVLNRDDDASGWVARSADTIKQNIYAAWTSKQEVENLSMTTLRTKFNFMGGFFDSKTLTSLYLENLLQAIRLASKYVGVDSIDSALNSYRGLAGREQIVKSQPYTIIVDYAYQPIVIDMFLTDVAKLVGEQSKLITVVGAAGQRGDSRKQVGLAAAKHSDIVLLCSQDPRKEDVSAINTKIAALAEPAGGVLVDRFIDSQEFASLPRQNLREKVERVIQNGDVPFVAFDAQSPAGRYNAIEYALELAVPGDIVVVLGKGDDDVMDFGDLLYEWNDERAIRDILESHNPVEIKPGIGSVIE